MTRSPVYKEHRWANADAKFKAALELRRRGHSKAALRITLLAIAAGPTLVFRPSRLMGLFPRFAFKQV